MVPGEAETGSAGEQPVKEYPGSAHRDDVLRMGSSLAPHPPIHIGSKADNALKNAKRKRYGRPTRTTLIFLAKVLFPLNQHSLEHHLKPTVFYRWQQEFFENGTAAFQRNKGAEERRTQERIAYLENRIQRKDEVLAELMMEHVTLKKTLGEP